MFWIKRVLTEKISLLSQGKTTNMQPPLYPAWAGASLEVGAMLIFDLMKILFTGQLINNVGIFFLIAIYCWHCSGTSKSRQ